MRLPKVMVPVLSSSKRVDVARRLDGASGCRDDVEADQPVHAGNADGREQAADRRWDQADEQRDQHCDRQRRPRIERERPERNADDEEDDCQAREKNRQSELVGRLLALRAFDERDHPVDEGGAGRGRDLHSDPVRENCRAACHGRSVAAGLAYDGRRLPGDGGLIDRSTAVDDFAIAGNEIAGFDEHDFANFEVERRDALINVSHARRAGRIDQALGVRVGACPSQRVSLRLAAAFRDGLGKIGEENREPEPGGDLPGEEGRALAATKIADEEGGDHD